MSCDRSLEELFCNERYYSPVINPEFVEKSERFSYFCSTTPPREGIVFDIPPLTLPPSGARFVERVRTSNMTPNKC